jgi:hypothetical protein
MVEPFEALDDPCRNISFAIARRRRDSVVGTVEAVEFIVLEPSRLFLQNKPIDARTTPADGLKLTKPESEPFTTLY